MHNALEEYAPNGFYFFLGNIEDPDDNTRGFILPSPTSSTCNREWENTLQSQGMLVVIFPI